LEKHGLLNGTPFKSFPPTVSFKLCQSGKVAEAGEPGRSKKIADKMRKKNFMRE
jgi:hypothetical protein